MSFNFSPVPEPFPRWLGPYSPARGDDSGFRVRNGRLGTMVSDDDVKSTWEVERSPGVRRLEQVVSQHWQGGRVLILPNGLVIKPLQRDGEQGERVVIGVIHGPVIVEHPELGAFNFAAPDQVSPGDRWKGPTTTGIECVIDSAGGLSCSWSIPTPSGYDKASHEVSPADLSLARGFRKARPEEQSGRVRVTANGHVITNRQVPGGWQSCYVGRIDVGQWPFTSKWVG